ncbi:DUF459 domain-containing protein [Companilactobacillus kedongensis]|uniref:DUF459 domain-containing protein n=1 Tax=Companilactobacillus kedongensis TaxID=2486004 RepID=UPI000F77D540|nr:GDSL-type esterase/lipase family protein [Companilactobacillus kedongensis]
MKKRNIWILAIIIILLVGGGVGYYFLNNQNGEKTTQVTKKSKPKKAKKKIKVDPNKSHINIVAVGDSLTQGVGDPKSVGGGYVTRLKRKIATKYKVKTSAYNYGVSGDTSTQIISRIKSDKKMHADLPKADVITVTVGGNDFMHLLQKKGIDLTESDIATEEQQFDVRLKNLLDDLRYYNNDAPIYLIGIYNPFSIYLANVKNAKTAFINWNKASAQVASEEKLTYFIDINNLYQTKEVDKKAKKTGTNPYLYKKDHFHPNGTGYDMMTEKVFDEVSKTTKDWLIK